MNSRHKETRMDEYQFQCLNVKAFYPLEDVFYKSYIAMIAFDCTLAPIAATLNCLVLVVIIKNKSLQTVPNCILFSLASSDMIAGLLIQPLKAAVLVQIIRRNVVCGLYITALQLGYLIGMTSYLSLTLMACERYFAIFYPFKYHNLTASKKIVVCPILAIWFFSALIMALSFITPQMTIMRLFVIALIPTSILWSAYVYIRACLLVKRINVQTAAVTSSDTTQKQVGERRKETRGDERRKDIRTATAVKNGVTQSLPCAGQVCPAVENQIPHVKDNNKIEKRRRKISSFARQGPNSKATRLAVLILIILVVCYIPSCVLTFTRDYSHIKTRWVFGIHDWGTSFVLLNSTLNPIIYCWKLGEMRAKIIALLRSFRCKKRDTNTV